MRINYFITPVGLTNDERCLIYNLRVEKHCDYERIVNMFSNK